MKKIALGLACAVLIIFTISQSAFASIDRIPYTLVNDFETGEAFSWEPYPYQQDIGYDPLFFTRQSPTFNDSRYALARGVRANDSIELYQGFLRQLDMWTTPQSRLKVAVFLQGDRNPANLELSLGLWDGRRYFHRIESPRANRWLELDIPVGSFKDQSGTPLRAGEHLQVVTITTTYPIVYYLFSYTILIDDFSLSGERQRRFTAIEPSSTDLEKFSVSLLNHHFFFGDTIGLSVIAEQGAPVSSVTGTLVNPSGRTVASNIRFFDNGTNGDKVPGDGIFTNSSIYRLTGKDQRGQWEIRLTGRNDSGRDVSWGFKFIMPGNRITPADHPRLYLTKDEMAALDPSKMDPVRRRFYENILNHNPSFMRIDISDLNEVENPFPEALTHGPYPKNRPEWGGDMLTMSNIIEVGAMRYAFGGDLEAGLKSKETLLKLCSFSSWNSAWMDANSFHTYFRVGRNIVKGPAVAYDLIYDLLTPEDRAYVRDAIMNKGVIPFYRDKVEQNRMPSHVTNHIGHNLSGIGLALISLYGEDPSNPTLEPYFSGILHKMEEYTRYNFKPGGGAGEPYTYYASGLGTMIQFWYSLEKNFGIEYSNTTHAKDYYLYPLWATHPSGRFPDFGDSGGRFGFTSLPALWFVNRLRDPFLYHYVKPHFERGTGRLYEFLLYTDGIEPKSREILPTSRVFETSGIMLMRSGWEEESTIISFKAGPNSNHLHYDQGSFVLMTNGEQLLSDFGYGTGYYENLFFVPYNIQAIGHNTLLLDMDPESQTPADYDNGIAALRSWPRIIHHFAGEIADAVEGDITCVYKDKLTNYTRTLLYTKSGPLFLFDRVNSKNGHEFNWIFHSEFRGGVSPISYSDGRVTIELTRSRLTMDVHSPELGSARIIHAVGGQDDGFIALNSLPGQKEAVFLAVLTPEAKPENGDYSAPPVSRRIDHQGWIGAVSERGNRADLAMFRLDSSSLNNVEGFTTDASRFTATFESGRLAKAYFEGSSFTGHGAGITTSSPVTAAVSITENGMDIEVKADRAVELKISADRPSRVLVNDTSVRNWRFDKRTGLLSINIQEGQSVIALK